MPVPHFDPTANDALRPYLGADETIVWSGRPRQGLMTETRDLVLIPFSLCVIGFALFWTWQVNLRGGPLAAEAVGILFALIGLYLFIGRFFTDAASRAATFYAITSHRLIILQGWPRSSIIATPLAALTNVSLKDHGNGRSTILAGTAEDGPFSYRTTNASQGNTVTRTVDRRKALRHIENGQAAFALLQPRAT